MKHLLTSIKHECQDYLRAWEQTNPELLEIAIRLVLCLFVGTLGGVIIGLIFWSVQVGFVWGICLACVMMLFAELE